MTSKDNDIGITITGANGRMGRMLVQAVAEKQNCRLIGAIGRQGADYIGKDAGALAGIGDLGVALTDDPHASFAASDAIIDFTPPPHMRHYAELAAQAHAAYICGSTGLDKDDWQALERAAEHTAVVYGANMSLGVNLLTELVRLTAERLGEDYDIEIIEAHHRHKKDAPSGTALSLGKAAADGRGIDHDKHMQAGRHGIGDERKRGDIGYAVSRGGSVIGEHQAVFYGDKERLELGHRAASRSLFADGAITAALWAAGKADGLYSMRDVLDLNLN